MRRPAFVRLAACLPFLLGVDLLQTKSRPIEEGNQALRAGKAQDALGLYDKAASKLPNDPGVHFNRGAALSALGKHDEAAQEFLRATEAKAVPLKASAFYNLGNSFFRKDHFGEAIEAYKRALALNPSDNRAKWNLELALKKKKEDDQKKEQEKKSKDDKNDDKNKDPDKDKQDQKDPQKPDPKDNQKKSDDQKQGTDNPKNDPDKNQQKDPDKPDQNSQKKDEPASPPTRPDAGSGPTPGGAGEPPAEPPPADMRELDAVLDSLERSPKALEQERARLRAVRRQPPEKDW